MSASSVESPFSVAGTGDASADRIDLASRLEDIWSVVRTYRGKDGTGALPAALSTRLDRIYQLRVVYLLRGSRKTEDSTSELFDHLNRVGRYAPAEYSIRWAMLRDILESFTVTLTQEKRAAEHRSPVIWDTVEKLIARSAETGMRQIDLLEALQKKKVGPQSKGGLSILLSRMIDAGRIVASRRGREVWLTTGQMESVRSTEKVVPEQAPIHAADSTPNYTASIHRAVESLLQRVNALEAERGLVPYKSLPPKSFMSSRHVETGYGVVNFAGVPEWNEPIMNWAEDPSPTAKNPLESKAVEAYIRRKVQAKKPPSEKGVPGAAKAAGSGTQKHVSGQQGTSKSR